MSIKATLKPWDHQVEYGKLAADMLKEYLLYYLAFEERTGKSFTAIIAAEHLNIKTVLIVTKKTAVAGWTHLLSVCKHNHVYQVVNYHQVKHISYKPDMLIIDEAHNYISGHPRAPTMYKDVKKLSGGIPILYLSATPHAQGYHMLYHQFKLSDWTPWFNYKTYFDWHREYGEPYTMYIHGRQIPKYDRVDEERIKPMFSHLFLTKTRKELGFDQEPVDKVHWITLDDVTKDAYNTITTDRVYEFIGGTVIADSKAKIRSTLHMLEGGVAKIKKRVSDDEIKDVYLRLTNREKIDYMLKEWGDTKDLVIMHQFKEEAFKLKDFFKNALILQGTSYAEGIDLYEYEHLVIYSQDYSTARHTQRRARQANKLRQTPIIVHYLLVEKAISSQVYKAVSINKLNYVDSLYEGVKL